MLWGVKASFTFLRNETVGRSKGEGLSHIYLHPVLPLSAASNFSTSAEKFLVSTITETSVLCFQKNDDTDSGDSSVLTQKQMRKKTQTLKVKRRLNQRG